MNSKTFKTCPFCGSNNVRFRHKRHNWICDDCDFVFEDSYDENSPFGNKEEVKRGNRVFISYGHDYSDAIKCIASDLRNEGYDVWLDTDVIEDGEDWRHCITEGILNSDVVLAFLSAYGLRDDGVCLDELTIAVGCNRNNIRTVLMEKEAIGYIPSVINGIEYIDMTEWKDLRNNIFTDWYGQKFNQLLSCLERALCSGNDPVISELERILQPRRNYESQLAVLKDRYCHRKWLEYSVEEWLKCQNQQVMIISAYMGGGKSFFCASYFYNHPYAICLAMLGQYEAGTYDILQIIRDISFCIASKLVTFRNNLLWLLKGSCRNINTMDCSELFRLLICSPFQMEIDGHHSPILLIIDGVDVLDEDESNQIVRLFSDNSAIFPKYLMILFTTRPSSCVLEGFLQSKILKLEPDSDFVANDMLIFLKEKLPDIEPSFINEIVGKFRGSFLHAELWANAVKTKQISPCIDNYTIPTMGTLYMKIMRKIFPSSDIYNKNRKAIALLVACEEGLPMKEFSSLLGWSTYDTNIFYRRIMSLTQRYIDSEGLYWIRIVYPSFVKWLTNEDDYTNEYIVTKSDSNQILADAVWKRYEKKELSLFQMSKIIEWLRNDRDKSRLNVIGNDDGLMKDALQKTKTQIRGAHSRTNTNGLFELCKYIAFNSKSEFSIMMSKGAIQYVDMLMNYEKDDYWKVIEIFEKFETEIKLYCSDVDYLETLFVAATAYDVIGERKKSLMMFESLYRQCYRDEPEYIQFKVYAVVGLMWYDHFNNISNGNCVMKDLVAMDTSSLTEDVKTMRQLVLARFALSQGNLKESLSLFREVIENNNGSIWGYGYVAYRNQLLSIESLVACFDNGEFCLGIEIGNRIFSHIKNNINIASCYCATWIALNYIKLGNLREAKTLLFLADSKNTKMRIVGPSKWMDMHICSVWSYYYRNADNYGRAVENLKRVISYSKEIDDAWVLGDACFDLYWILKLKLVEEGSLKECTFPERNVFISSILDTIEKIAEQSKLPHLQYKALLMRCWEYGDDVEIKNLIYETKEKVFTHKLAGIDYIMIMVFVYMILISFYPDSEQVDILVDNLNKEKILQKTKNEGNDFFYGRKFNNIIKTIKI